MDVWYLHKRQKENEELRRLVGVDLITSVIKSGRLRWYGHVMRKSDEDWMNKCVEFRVEGRRLFGRPRRTLLESVEADIIIIIIIIHKHLYSAKYQPSVLMRSL